MTGKRVEIVYSAGGIVSGEFALWEEAPENPDQVRLDLHFAGETITAVADTFFDALADIRKVLEGRGLRPKCFGACRDVYPSPMIRSMGSGEKVYRLKLGCQAKMEDLIPIFASDPEITPASVEEQEEYYRQWLKSLKRKKLCIYQRMKPVRRPGEIRVVGSIRSKATMDRKMQSLVKR